MSKAPSLWHFCRSEGTYICDIHKMPVSDCPCPPIDEWLYNGIDPYAPVPTEHEDRVNEILEEYAP